MDAQNVKTPIAYGLGVFDLGIIKKELKLNCTGVSPLAGDGRIEGELSEEVKELLGDNRFKNAMAVMAAPDFKIPFYKGGGIEISERFSVYGKQQGEITSLISLQAGKDAIILCSFENVESFAVWFANGYASNAQNQVANIIKPKLTVEEFICIFNLVDCYKRVQMSSMLDYKFVQEPFISDVDYAITLKMSTEKKDLRWLLPTFIELMPGLLGKKIDISKEHLDAAISIGLITEFELSENKVIYKFNVSGRVLGVEFDKTWSFGVGFNVITNKGQSNGMFLAPTSMTNHLFTLEEGKISHMALTQEDLANAMCDIINSIKI